MSSSSIDPVETAIPEDPTGVKGLSPAEGKNQSELALSVENNTASVAEPGTMDTPEARTGVDECNEAKYDGDVVVVDSPIEGLLMNGSVASNGEVGPTKKEPLSLLKTLEGADALFQKGCDALKADDFREVVDSLSRALEIRFYLFSTCC